MRSARPEAVALGVAALGVAVVEQLAARAVVDLGAQAHGVLRGGGGAGARGQHLALDGGRADRRLAEGHLGGRLEVDCAGGRDALERDRGSGGGGRGRAARGRAAGGATPSQRQQGDGEGGCDGQGRTGGAHESTFGSGAGGTGVRSANPVTLTPGAGPGVPRRRRLTACGQSAHRWRRAVVRADAGSTATARWCPSAGRRGRRRPGRGPCTAPCAAPGR